MARAVLAAYVAALCAADYVHVVKDGNGTWWFEHNGQRWLNFAVNHVNNGGLDDGVGGREAAVCQAATGNPLCGDSLNFGGKLGYAPYHNVTVAKYANESVWAETAVSRLQGFGFNGISGWSASVAEAAAAEKVRMSLLFPPPPPSRPSLSVLFNESSVIVGGHGAYAIPRMQHLKVAARRDRLQRGPPPSPKLPHTHTRPLSLSLVSFRWQGMYYWHLLDIGVTWPFAWSKGLDFDVWSSNFSAQAESVAAGTAFPTAVHPAPRRPRKTHTALPA
jgi:hypothetical protein